VLALSHDPEGWQVPILRTEAARGEGVTELAEAIDRHRTHIEAAGTLAQRRARNLRNEVLGIATSRMRRRMEATAANDPETAELLERVVRRELDPASAASELLARQADG
jgi:LAO/AO transport system kinase